MKKLGQLLRMVFWLPILLAGFVGFAFINPGSPRLRMVSLVALTGFVLLALLQELFERRRKFLRNRRADPMSTVRTKASDSTASDWYRPMRKKRAAVEVAPKGDH